MIQEEMNMMDSSLYQTLDTPKLSNVFKDNHIILQNEFARLESGQSMINMDISRYSMPYPLEPNEFLWKRAVQNACSQIEHQYKRYHSSIFIYFVITFRMDNVKLLEEYGEDIWKNYQQQLECLELSLKRQLQRIQDDISIQDTKRELYKASNTL